MNGVDFPVAKVLDGIDAARAAGLAPIQGQHGGRKKGEKRGQHRAHGPLGPRRGPDPPLHRVHGRRHDQRLAAGRRRARPPRSWPRSTAELPLEPAAPSYPGEVAERWRYRDGSGEIGVIASVSQPFCGDCTRARLSAEGKLYTCLFSASGTDLRGPLRSGATDDDLRGIIERLWGGPGRPLLGASLGRHEPPPTGWRCSPSAAEAPPGPRPPTGPSRTRAARPHLSTARQQVSKSRGHVVDRPAEHSWITTLPGCAGATTFRLARRGRQGTRRPEITSREATFRTGRFGRFVTRSRPASVSVPGWSPGGM